MNRPWALITGCAKRIGRAIALDLAAHGWNIIVHYNSSQVEAEQLVRDIQDLGSDARLAKIDLMQRTGVSTLIPTLSQEIGDLSLLINNASLFEPDSCDPTGKRHKMVNVETPRILSESLAALNNQDQPKIIINILDADPTKPDFSAYNASKIALRDLTLDHARRFAPHTCVHGIALGAILPSPRESAEHFQAMVDQSPLKRHPSPDDISRCVRFLAETPTMTGTIIPLDGGVHLGPRRTSYLQSSTNKIE